MRRNMAMCLFSGRLMCNKVHIHCLRLCTHASAQRMCTKARTTSDTYFKTAPAYTGRQGPPSGSNFTMQTTSCRRNIIVGTGSYMSY